jgi:CheY-like chemotaxis protein
MRIIRAVSTDGHMIIGDDRGDGSATLLLDPAGLVSPGEDQLPETAPPDAAQLAALNGKRALVADDDDTMRETVCAVLNRFGCETVPCRDGEEARRALQDNELDIDLVVSDIAMPHANGYEVFSIARSRRPNMPVILITGFGYDPNHSLVRATKEGLGATLYKPFTPEQLVGQVREALRAAQAEPSSLVLTTESSRFERLLAGLVGDRPERSHPAPALRGYRSPRRARG